MNNNNKMVALALVGMLVAGTANAGKDDLWIDLNVGSKHFAETNYKYNERNLGFGFSYGLTDGIEAKAGYYENSFRKNSKYAGLNFKHDVRLGQFTVSPGVTLGLVTGYDNTPVHAKAIQPIVAPGLAVERDGLRLVLAYNAAKTFGFAKSDVLMIQVGYKFK